MSSPELLAQKNKIEHIISEAEALPIDQEIGSHMAKYICILCSGFMENAVFYIYSSYAQSKINKRSILNYLDHQLLRINNPNSVRLKEIAKSFKISWAEDLVIFMQEENRSTALNSIMRERHKIAHGRNSTITISTVKDYFEKCIEIVNFMESQCQSCAE